MRHHEEKAATSRRPTLRSSSSRAPLLQFDTSPRLQSGPSPTPTSTTRKVFRAHRSGTKQLHATSPFRAALARFAACSSSSAAYVGHVSSIFSTFVMTWRTPAAAAGTRTFSGVHVLPALANLARFEGLLHFLGLSRPPRARPRLYLFRPLRPRFDSRSLRPRVRLRLI